MAFNTLPSDNPGDNDDETPPTKKQRCNLFTCTRAPSDLSDINSYYLRNSTSILKNIPCPAVTLVDSHAYVSISDIIEHFCAHGLPFDEIQLNVNVSQQSIQKHAISQSLEAENIRQEVIAETESTSVVPMILYIIIWADDFEVNRVKKIGDLHGS